VGGQKGENVNSTISAGGTMYKTGGRTNQASEKGKQLANNGGGEGRTEKGSVCVWAMKKIRELAEAICVEQKV